MNRESRTTILLDAFTKGDDEVVYSMMRVRVDCLRRATCPGCGWCNGLTIASSHSATRIDDMENSRQHNPRVVSDEANGYTTVYKRLKTCSVPDLEDLLAKVRAMSVEHDNALAHQLHEEELVADKRASATEESDAALARQLYQEDELVAGMRSSVIEESDAALARQLYHDDLVAAGGI